MNDSIKMTVINQNPQLGTYSENDTKLPQNKDAIELVALKKIKQLPERKLPQNNNTIETIKTIPQCIEKATKVFEKSNVFSSIVYGLNDYSPPTDVFELNGYSLGTRTPDETLQEFWEACHDILSTLNLNRLPSKSDNAKVIREWIKENEGELLKIKIMNFSGKGLKELPPEIGYFKGLTDLCLSHNQLTTLPVEIGKLLDLESLNLSNNKLTTFPAAVGKQFTDLQSINLSGNKLTTLPSEIGELELLLVLILANNELTAIPKEIGNLELYNLDLTNNRLTTVPQEIALIGKSKDHIPRIQLKNNTLSAETLLWLESQNKEEIKWTY